MMGLGGAALGSCIDLQPYRCSADDDCRSQAIAGQCQAVGYCSYPDQQCDSGQRFSDLAGPLASQCTEPAGTSGEGSTGSSTGDASSTGGESSTGADSSDSADPICGDGVPEAGEECDDGNAIDGDGCNVDCVAGGSVRWSAVIVGAAGNDDRYLGLELLPSDELVAVGQIVEEPGNRDLLISRWSPEGDELVRHVYDVDGGADDAHAVVYDGGDLLMICGRANVGGSSRPWMSTWSVALDDAAPARADVIPGVYGVCRDIEWLDDTTAAAVGGTGSTAWAYTFPLADPIAGEVASIAGTKEERTPTLFKAAEPTPEGGLVIGGQVDGLGVAYVPPLPADLGEALYTTTAWVQVQSMALTDDGFILAGLLREAEENDDLWVASLDPEGSERWVWAPSRPSVDEVEDIALDPAGNIYAVGHDTIGNKNSERWVGKLDPAGTLVWERSDYELGEFGDDRVRAIEIMTNGDLVVVGEVINAEGDHDAWIARLAP